MSPIILRCRKCRTFHSHRFLGAVILSPCPMMEEKKGPRPGEYMCGICGTILVLDENGQVVEGVELAARRDKEDMFGPDSLDQEERELLGEGDSK